MTDDTKALEAKARAGDAAAQFELAVTLDRAGQRIVATSWLEAAGNSGHVEALALLAIRDLQGLETRPDPPLAGCSRPSRRTASSPTRIGRTH
jgi:hypothetical protein